MSETECYKNENEIYKSTENSFNTFFRKYKLENVLKKNTTKKNGNLVS